MKHWVPMITEPPIFGAARCSRTWTTSSRQPRVGLGTSTTEATSASERSIAGDFAQEARMEPRSLRRRRTLGNAPSSDAAVLLHW